MNRVLEALEQIVMPRLRAGGGSIIPGIRPAASPGTMTFYEGYSGSWPHGAWVWVLSGGAHVRMDGSIYEVRPGDLHLIPPNVPYTDVYHRNTDTGGSLWFINSPRRLDFGMTLYQPFGRYSYSSLGSIHAPPEIGSLLLALHNETLVDAAYAQQVTDGILIQLTALLLREFKAALSADKPLASGSISARVIAYLNLHYAENLTLASIARSTYFSPSYLATVFKAETGHTIFQHLARLRIERATRLLVEDRMPVHHVAAAVGYQSLDHFSRVFRQLKGVPPSRYVRFVGSADG